MSISARFQTTLGEFSLHADFEVPGKGVTALFGHSGSGKTTVLRCMAGLEQAQHGRLVINGDVWQDNTQKIMLPTHRRPLGYVFQEASLFPHLNVQRNLEYGQKRIAHAQRRVQLLEAVELLGIGHLLERSPARLSGGERQRVAIARALLTSPQLLLMDEPLSALDEKSKHDILPYLERLHAELAIPVVYVSHSLKEVARLADYMVWMEKGRVRAAGPLQEVLSRLDADLVQDEEAGAVMDAVIAEHDEHYHLTALESSCGRIWVRQLEQRVGDSVRIRLPARDISLNRNHDQQSSILNIWPVKVLEIGAPNQGQVLVRLQCCTGDNCTVLLARITLRSREQLNLEEGQELFAQVKSVGLVE